MKPLILLSLLGALAAPAAADDWAFGFGFGKSHRGNRFAISVGYSERHRHRHRHDCCEYVPGHYETVQRRVWVPGGCETVWQPAQWGWRHDACGRRVRYLVRPAGYVTVQVAGRWECVEERVWVPGRYACGH